MSKETEKWLKRNGLNNTDAPTMKDLVSDKVFYRAVCYNCAVKAQRINYKNGRKSTTLTYPGVEKQVPKSTSMCPDCGNFLHWKKRAHQ